MKILSLRDLVVSVLCGNYCCVRGGGREGHKTFLYNVLYGDMKP